MAKAEATASKAAADTAEQKLRAEQAVAKSAQEAAKAAQEALAELVSGRAREAAGDAAREAVAKADRKKAKKGRRLLAHLDDKKYPQFVWGTPSDTYVEFSDFLRDAYGDDGATHKPDELRNGCVRRWGWAEGEEFARRSGKGAGKGRPWVCKVSDLRAAIENDYGLT